VLNSHADATQFLHSSLAPFHLDMDMQLYAKGLHQWLSIRWKDGSMESGNAHPGPSLAEFNSFLPNLLIPAKSEPIMDY